MPGGEVEGHVVEDTCLAIVALDPLERKHHAPRYALWTSGFVSISRGVPSAMILP